MVARTSRAALAIGDRAFRIDELPVPEVGESDGLLRVEACGVCGSDLNKYAVNGMPPTVLGHETVGRVERLGRLAAERWGVEAGDRVLLEEYLPCGHCGYCRSGEYRSCRETELGEQGAVRYGSTPVAVAPGLWGGYSQFLYLHHRSVPHRVPDGVPPHHATFALPLSNGIQWMQYDAGAGPGQTVVIQGPGQQGVACLLAARAAGVQTVVVTGLTRDADRLARAGRLGADAVVDVETEDVASMVEKVSAGQMADIAIDCTGGGAATFNTSIAVVRRRGTVIVASKPRKSAIPAVADLAAVQRKQLTVLGVRGHSFRAVRAALRLIGSGGVGHLDEVCAPPVPLDEIGDAFAQTAGTRTGDALHASVAPWL